MSWNGNTYIVELRSKELRVLAQLIHAGLAHRGEDSNLDDLLNTLVAQTDCVHREPRKHGVFPDPLTAPGGAKSWGEAWVVRAI